MHARVLLACLWCITWPVAAAPLCHYDVAVSAAFELSVRARCDGEVRGLRPASHAAQRFVTALEMSPTDAGLLASYRVDLAAMARQESDLDSAVASGASLLAVGSAWLLSPERDGGVTGTLRVRVVTPPGMDFATAQPMVDGGFDIPAGELTYAGFSAFGHLERWPMQAPGDGGTPARYELIVLDGDLAVGRQVIREWMDDSARALAEFWRGFPGPDMKVFALPRPGRGGVPFGRVMSGGGVSMALLIGEHATRAELYDDWVLIHELVHVGTPFVRGAPWLSEGLATYFEPLIRARWGRQSEADMWLEFARYMPRGAAVFESTGLAAGGFRGWYWGGALLFLLADLEMRRDSQGHIGLEDCLNDTRRRVGNYAARMPATALLSACDTFSGGRVLATLVDRYANAANPVDLDAMWRDLGITVDGGGVGFDDDAPLAWVRHSIVIGSRGESDGRVRAR